MTRITDAIGLLHRGEREEARLRFDAIWCELGDDGDPLHRCVAAHYMADAQDDARDALRWDLRALDAARELTEARVQAHEPTMTLASFYPSLHLNLAAGYEKLAMLEEARAHIVEARARASGLVGTELGRMTLAAITRLESTLEGAQSGEA